MHPDLFANLVTFAEALGHVRAAVTPIERTETLPIDAALGRVVAVDVTARFDVPSFARALMDGYAVRTADLADATPERPTRLTVAAVVTAGDGVPAPLTRGRCAEIATGAPLPPGADAVVMVERTSRDGPDALFRDRVEPGQNVGRRGADIERGRTAVARGAVLTPARAGATVAAGWTDVTVYAQPTVAVLVTGNEVVAAGGPLAEGQVHDVNTTTIASVVAAHGGTIGWRRRVADSTGELTAALTEAASACDVVVCSGGSSVGRKDLLGEVMSTHGTTIFHGIATKPGKPTLFGRLGRTPLFGMPGNPTSCLTNAYLLLVPFVRMTARLPPWRPERVEARLARRVAATPGRHHFCGVRIVDGTAVPVFKSSSDITSLTGADGYIEIPADSSGMEAETVVTVTRF